MSNIYNDFVLYVQIGDNYVPLSSNLDDKLDNKFSTLDENLNEEENSKYTLTFKMPIKIVDNGITKTHPLMPHMYLGTRLKLQWNGTLIYLIISNMKPSSTTHNIVYEFTAQDEPSYLWSRQHVGYSYRTEDEEGNLTIKTIYQVAKEILVDNFLHTSVGGKWSLPSLASDIQTDYDNYIGYERLTTQQFSLEVENSNPYAALVEACNTVNAYMKIDHKNYRISFFRKDNVQDSGYRYHPDRNLLTYSSDYSGEELCTMLHVSGGEDEFGNIITLTPDIPPNVEIFLKSDDGQTLLSELRNGTKTIESFWTEVKKAIANVDDEGNLTVKDNYLLPIQYAHIPPDAICDSFGDKADVYDINNITYNEIDNNKTLSFFDNNNTKYTIGFEPNSNTHYFQPAALNYNFDDGILPKALSKYGDCLSRNILNNNNIAFDMSGASGNNYDLSKTENRFYANMLPYNIIINENVTHYRLSADMWSAAKIQLGTVLDSEGITHTLALYLNPNTGTLNFYWLGEGDTGVLQRLEPQKQGYINISVVIAEIDNTIHYSLYGSFNKYSSNGTKYQDGSVCSSQLLAGLKNFTFIPKILTTLGHAGKIDNLFVNVSNKAHRYRNSNETQYNFTVGGVEYQDEKDDEGKLTRYFCIPNVLADITNSTIISPEGLGGTYTREGLDLIINWDKDEPDQVTIGEKTLVKRDILDDFCIYSNTDSSSQILTHHSLSNFNFILTRGILQDNIITGPGSYTLDSNTPLQYTTEQASEIVVLFSDKSFSIQYNDKTLYQNCTYVKFEMSSTDINNISIQSVESSTLYFNTSVIYEGKNNKSSNYYIFYPDNKNTTCILPKQYIIKKCLCQINITQYTKNDYIYIYNHSNQDLNILENYGAGVSSVAYALPALSIIKIKKSDINGNELSLLAFDLADSSVMLETDLKISLLDETNVSLFNSYAYYDKNANSWFNLGHVISKNEAQKLLVPYLILRQTIPGDYIQSEKNKQYNSVQEFFKIIETIPYGGNSIINFIPFTHKISSTQKKYINDLLRQYLYYNINLNLQSKEYYYLLYNISVLRQNIQTIAQNYASACLQYLDIVNSINSSQEQISKAKEEIQKQVNSLYTTISTKGYIDNIIDLGIAAELSIIQGETPSSLLDNFFKNEIENLTNAVQTYQEEQFNNYNTETSLKIPNTTNAQYYTEKIRTTQSLISTFDGIEIVVDNKTIPAYGAYQLADYIINKVLLTKYNINNPEGVYTNYHTLLKEKDNNFTKPFYNSFGKFIYEQSYENQDELDSIALYNQAIAYFADINKPQASYSAEVIDICSLEHINVPKLSIGNYISVYNPATINMIPYLAEINEIDVAKQIYAQKLNTNAWTASTDREGEENYIISLENALVDKYNADKGLIDKTHPDYIQTYSQLESKLYEDRLYISSISRNLREPLKDSLTVEESSRYKTILSKLIKSI